VRSGAARTDQAPVNGETKQDAVVADMIWDVAAIISEASKLWRLAPGDVIYIGASVGVGPMVTGELLAGEIEGVGALSFLIT
jgi:fumarylpyruvate hydrolase